MSFDYGRSKATADRLINKFGKQTVLQKPGAKTGSGYDATEGDPTNYVISLVDLYRRTLTVDPVLRRSSKRTVYISAQLGVEIESGDRILLKPGTTSITISGITYTGRFNSIEEIRKLSPGETTVMWEVDLES